MKKHKYIELKIKTHTHAIIHSHTLLYIYEHGLLHNHTHAYIDKHAHTQIHELTHTLNSLKIVQKQNIHTHIHTTCQLK